MRIFHCDHCRAQVFFENFQCLSCGNALAFLPDLAEPGNQEKWYRIEVAKRRLLYTLLALKLPVVSREEDPQRGLEYQFLADLPGGP